MPGNTKPDIFRTDRVTRSVNRLFYSIIIFQTKMTFLKNLHIVSDVILMFTNRLSSIKGPKIEQDRK